MLPSWSQQLGVRPSQAKITPCPLPPNVSPGVGFSRWPFLSGCMMAAPATDCGLCPRHCNIGQKKVRPPTLNDYCPLVMNVVELRQHMGRYITFNKWDVFQNLGSTIPEGCKLGHGDSTRGPHYPAPHSWCWRHRVKFYRSLGAHYTNPLSFGCPPEEETPPAEPTIQPAEVDVKDTLPGTAETPPGGDITVFSTASGVETPKDLPTS